MIVCENGVCREATTDEIAEREAWEREHEHDAYRYTPTPKDRMEAQVLYTALMTDTLLEG